MSRKLNIRRSIERLLLPELENRGFQRHPQPDPELLRDSSIPFGQYVRRGVRGTDVVEIHFDKYQRSHFRLNLSVIPPDRTVDEAWKPGDPARVHHVLTKRGLFFRPCFGTRRRNPPPGEAEFDAAVNEAIALLPEVEDLFRSGLETRRMKRMPARTYGIGRFRYAAATYVIFAIPVALLTFIVGAVHWIAQHRPYEGSLVGWTFFAGLLLATWCWFLWRALRP